MKISLKCKMALYSAVVFFVLMPLLVSVALNYFEDRFTTSIKDQLFTTVSLLAEDLDREIAATHSIVTTAARGIPADLLSEPARALSYLQKRYGLLETFDNGLVLISTDGKIIAETLNRPSRVGFDLSFRPYYQKTLETKRPYISAPFISTQNHQQPVIVLTAPIQDDSGKVLGILGGSIDLLGKNVLGALAKAEVGETGYFYLYTKDRTMVMHPNRSRIMQQDVPKGSNHLFDKAIQGFEGAGETVNSRGLHTLAAFKSLRSVDWILAANYPIAEAFAPVWKAERTSWTIVIIGGLVIAVIMWLGMRHLIGPLLSLIGQVKAITNRCDTPQRVTVKTRDEIGVLAGSFNTLMSERNAQRQELAQSQELYQTLADWSVNWIFWKSASGKMLYVSPAGSRITGYSNDELMAFGENFDQLVHQDDRELWQQHQHGAHLGHNQPALDFRIVTKSGDVRWISHACQPIHDEDGHYVGLRGSNADITERKRIEEELRHLSSRDSLTGLYNRGHFDAEMASLARGRQFPAGVVIADLDGLKGVNDEQGHAAGDMMIKQAGRLLLKAFRADDVVARIGGDEFAILMPDADETAVSGAVRRIRKLEAEHNGFAKNFRLSMSLGTAAAYDGGSLESALETADARMYSDKKMRKAKETRRSGRDHLPVSEDSNIIPIRQSN